MALSKFTGATNNIQSLADKPTTSATILKYLFDKTGYDLSQYLNNTLTTELDTQLGLKANAASPIFTGTVTLPTTTSIGAVNSTELGYLNGVTSAIQTQINSKVTASDSGWYAMTYIPGSYSAGTAGTLQYRKINGIVYLQGGASPLSGTFTPNTYTNCFSGTLPAGYRPGSTIRAGCAAQNSNAGIFQVKADGTIELASAATVTWIGGTISFPADN